MLYGGMDINRLLQLVAARRPLWFNKGSYNREEVHKLWVEVGTELNTSGYIAKLKWQNLRDTFRKEVTKLKKAREMNHSYAPTWRHFRQMGFVLELADPESWQEWKKTNPTMYALAQGISNPSTSTSSGTFQGQNDQSTLTISRVVSLQEPEANQSPYIALEPDVSVKLEEEIENSMEPITSFSVDENSSMFPGEDEDYHFLTSLLPHLREIPKKRKLHVRQKLQQVIIDEMKD